MCEVTFSGLEELKKHLDCDHMCGFCIQKCKITNTFFSPKSNIFWSSILDIFNRPGVAGVVQQTPPWFIDKLIQLLMLFLQIFKTSNTPNPLELGGWNLYTMFITSCVSCVICHMSHITCLLWHVMCHMSCVTCHKSCVTCKKTNKQKTCWTYSL